MKQILKTVYIPVKGDYPKYVVDENIPEFYDTVEEQQLITFTQEEFNSFIKKVIEDTLENAAKNVTYKMECGKLNSEKCCAVFCYNCNYIIDKQSITNTFEGSYLKFKL